MLQSMGLERVRHNLAVEQQQQQLILSSTAGPPQPDVLVSWASLATSQEECLHPKASTKPTALHTHLSAEDQTSTPRNATLSSQKPIDLASSLSRFIIKPLKN